MSETKITATENPAEPIEAQTDGQKLAPEKADGAELSEKELEGIAGGLGAKFVVSASSFT